MNTVHSLSAGKMNYKNDMLPIQEFFINHENVETQKRSKAIEKLIEKYSLNYQAFIIDHKRDYDEADWLLARTDYEDLLEDIRRIALPDKYVGLMSWLINRCFVMTPGMLRNRNNVQSKLSKNRSLLLKILYDLNPKTFKKCFKKG